MIDPFSTARSRWWPQLREVLRHYPLAGAPVVEQVTDFACGFSGAVVWRVQTPRGACCLRGWPPDSVTPQRVGWLQRQLLRIAESGCDLVPRPLATGTGAACVRVGGRLWELSTWLSGCADYASAPSAARLESAARALARFHQAARSGAARSPGTSAAPALARRLALIDALRGGLWSALRTAPLPPACPGLAPRAATILDHYARSVDRVAAELRAAQRFRTPLQLCHGDLWHDHVLFSGERVTGLIDFDAMRVDARAADLARLFGSLAGDDAAAWRTATAAYQQVAPLQEDEPMLIRVLDQSTVLLAGISWLRWLLCERREFPAWPPVLQRLDAIIDRLQRLS